MSHRRPIILSCIARRVWLIAMLLASTGCWTGRGPGAYRVKPDDLYLPRGEIHFVEHGRRSRGVLVGATPGFENAFGAVWFAMLVPTPPTPLAGPLWTGEKVRDAEAVAMSALPQYRDSRYLCQEGDWARARFEEVSVWILSTDPFIVGLPAGEPLRNWREYALAETGSIRAGSPSDPFVARFVVAGELDQRIAKIVVYPPEFWRGEVSRQVRLSMELSLVTLPTPLPIGDVLDRLTVRDPKQLGVTETVAMGGPRGGRSWRADQERLMRSVTPPEP